MRSWRFERVRATRSPAPPFFSPHLVGPHGIFMSENVVPGVSLNNYAAGLSVGEWLLWKIPAFTTCISRLIYKALKPLYLPSYSPHMASSRTLIQLWSYTIGVAWLVEDAIRQPSRPHSTWPPPLMPTPKFLPARMSKLCAGAWQMGSGVAARPRSHLSRL